MHAMVVHHEPLALCDGGGLPYFIVLTLSEHIIVVGQKDIHLMNVFIYEEETINQVS